MNLFFMKSKFHEWLYVIYIGCLVWYRLLWYILELFPRSVEFFAVHLNILLVFTGQLNAASEARFMPIINREREKRGDGNHK